MDQSKILHQLNANAHYYDLPHLLKIMDELKTKLDRYSSE